MQSEYSFDRPNLRRKSDSIRPCRSNHESNTSAQALVFGLNLVSATRRKRDFDWLTVLILETDFSPAVGERMLTWSELSSQLTLILIFCLIGNGECADKLLKNQLRGITVSFVKSERVPQQVENRVVSESAKVLIFY